jgi:hypothetical protein
MTPLQAFLQVLASGGGLAIDNGSDSGGNVEISAEITGVAGQERCTPEGDGPYVVDLPRGFGTSIGPVKGGPVGSGECIVLPQVLLEAQGSPLGKAGFGRLRRGPAVMGNKNLKRGTLIASGWHPDGYYANYYPHGNHAAIFLSFIPNGIRVYEQVDGHLQVVDKINAAGGYYSNPNAYNVVLTGSRIPGVPGNQRYPF